MQEIDNGKNLHMLTLDCEAKPQTEEFLIEGERVVSVLIRGYCETEPEEEKLYTGAEKIRKTPLVNEEQIRASAKYMAEHMKKYECRVYKILS